MRAPKRCAKAGCNNHQPCKTKGHQRGWSNPGPNYRPLPSNWESLIKQVKARDNYRCVLCGSRKQLEIDHVVPRSAGGTDQISNLRTLCKKDHKEKTRDDARDVRSQRSSKNKRKRSAGK